MQDRFTSSVRRSVGSLLGITLLALGAGVGCSVEPHEFSDGAGGASSASSTSDTSTTSSTSTGMGGSGGGCSGPADCDDSDACTDDSCNEGVCANTPVDVADTDACTVDACDPATGAISHDPDPGIDDGDACTTDTCDTVTGAIAHDAVNADDGDACTDDSCDPLVGVMHMPTAIDDMDACTADSCDVLLGVAHDPIDPDDANACTSDSCDVLLGVQNAAIDPSDGNACTTDSCDPVSGVANLAIDPDDNNKCTNDSCDIVLGVQNVALDPSDGNACTTDSCDPFQGVQNVPVAIPGDSDLCTTDSCNPVNGQFVYTPIPIDDGDGCTVDSCKKVSGAISHTPVAVPSDANLCTLDRCTSVNNQPTYSYPANVVLFSDDFKDNSKGWTLGTEWAIGPAVASSGLGFGNDPAQDHTATADNGVAGVVLGGGYSATVHGYYYLESPTINAAVPNGEVVLTFWRWLNSDYAAFAYNTVDVYDGSTWVNLWTSPGSPGVADQPTTGNGWTLIDHNLTPYANANLKVRFGFSTGNGIISGGGWNVDDVLIENRTFPSDNSLCTADTCNPLTGGATFTPIPVTDGDACTTDSCDATRAFVHTLVGASYMAESFNGLVAPTGWTAGTEWGFGAATVSSGNVYGNPDPAFDFSPSTTDNGIAGVVIGGNASVTTHTAYYLTSKTVSTSGLPSGQKLYLTFRRWLNSDYSPYMVNTVEVYNGLTWVSLFASGASPGVQDAAWTLQQFDITAHKNALMQVRWGFTSSTNALTVSQWNLDDVAIQYCP